MHKMKLPQIRLNKQKLFRILPNKLKFLWILSKNRLPKNLLLNKRLKNRFGLGR